MEVKLYTLINPWLTQQDKQKLASFDMSYAWPNTLTVTRKNK